MRTRVLLPLLLLLPALAGLEGASVAADPGDGSRPPMLTPYPTPPAKGVSTPAPGLPTPPPGSAPSKGAPNFMPVSMFGMNLYLTGLERGNNEANLLGGLAAQAGVKWSREELSWANIEPQAKGQFNWGVYDTRLGYDAANGINVIGMLLTTPRWASTNPNAGDYFWYEPSNYNDY